MKLDPFTPLAVRVTGAPFDTDTEQVEFDVQVP
jgi:hypothetical protein